MKSILLVLAFILGASALAAQEVDTTEVKVDRATYMKYTGYERVVFVDANPLIKDIPVQLLHQFSLDLQKSDFKLVYDKNNSKFKRVRRLERAYPISCSKILDLE